MHTMGILVLSLHFLSTDTCTCNNRTVGMGTKTKGVYTLIHNVYTNKSIKLQYTFTEHFGKNTQPYCPQPEAGVEE